MKIAHQRPLATGQLVWIKPHRQEDLALDFVTHSGTPARPIFFQRVNMDTFPSATDFKGAHTVRPGQPAIVMECRGVPSKIALYSVKHPEDADLNIYDVLVDDTILQIFGCDLVGGMDGIFDYKLGKKDETR